MTEQEKVRDFPRYASFTYILVSFFFLSESVG